MPKLKPEEIETRRQEIIEAARRCFLRSGFHQTTTDEICHEASITPGGLYHYFDSKEAIISSVIEEAARAAVSRLWTMTDSASDAQSAFREVATFFNQIIRDADRDSVTRFDIETWAETLRNEKLAAITRKTWAMRREWLEALIKRGVDDGMYREDVNPRGLTDLLLAMLMGLRLGRVLWREDFDLEGAVASLFQMHAGQLIAGETDLGLRPGNSGTGTVETARRTA